MYKRQNQYIPSQYTGKDFAFEITGNYPESENMQLTIVSEKAKNKTLNLRIPSWCEHPEIKVNGENIADVKPGAYLKLSRKWTKGDKVSITFPMEEKWVSRSLSLIHI